MLEPLQIRKLADKSEGERVPGFHPRTGVRTLVNPATDEPEPWPLLGIAIVGDAPAKCRVPTSFVERGRAEGWIEAEGERVEHRPGGPPESRWRLTHTFIHLDTVVLKTVDGDLRYRVVHQPDKYGEANDGKVTDARYNAGETRVDWFYDLELEG